MVNSDIKTSREIIDKWKNLQLFLIKKEGDIYSHEKFEKKLWIPADLFNQAKEDFEKAFNGDGRQTPFKDTMYDLITRYGRPENRGGYPAEFLAKEAEIYWLCLTKLFRDEVNEFKSKSVLIEDVEGMIIDYFEKEYHLGKEDKACKDLITKLNSLKGGKK